MTRKLAVGISLLVVGLTLIVTGWIFAGRGRAQGNDQTAVDWSQRVIRLHVIANSDSEADQALKRAVRDAILAEVTSQFTDVKTPDEARIAITRLTPRMKELASDVVTSWEQQYPIKVELGRFAFPGKAYGTLFLPAGEYTALRVVIGDGEGANWWCVLFPPLCFTDWTTGLVLEPKAGTGGQETEIMHRPPEQQHPLLVDADQEVPVQVRGRLRLLERFWPRRTVRVK